MRHGSSGVATVLLLFGLLAAYLVPAWRRQTEPRGWSGWRIGSVVSGVVLLGFALVPGVLPAGDFRGHMLAHLLIGMLAPLFLVLGAPVTLLLRSVTPRWGRFVGSVLRSRPMHVLASPTVALVLNLGGLLALYSTPLYAVMQRNNTVHVLVMAHFFAAGYLFAWVIAGPDPAPRRPSVRVRLVVLGVAVAGHAVLSQLLYAGVLDIPVPVVQRQGAAELMYYGGDIAELMVAVALVSTWRPRRGIPPTLSAGAGGGLPPAPVGFSDRPARPRVG